MRFVQGSLYKLSEPSTRVTVTAVDLYAEYDSSEDAHPNSCLGRVSYDDENGVSEFVKFGSWPEIGLGCIRVRFDDGNTVLVLWEKALRK